MGKAVKVPQPVYEQITHESEKKDVPRGIIIREWMDKAEKWDEFEGAMRR